MQVHQLSLHAIENNRYLSQVSLRKAIEPVGQTSFCSPMNPDDNSITWLNSQIEFKPGLLSEGITIDGYFLGTYDFDSLTGHPGIRY